MQFRRSVGMGVLVGLLLLTGVILALLKLRGFKLPPQIFLGEGGATAPYAQNGR